MNLFKVINYIEEYITSSCEKLVGSLIVAIYVYRNLVFYKNSLLNHHHNVRRKNKIINLYYGSQNGKTMEYTHSLMKLLENSNITCNVWNMQDINVFDFIASYSKEKENDGTANISVFLISTFEGGKPPYDVRIFFDQLVESVNDFRLSKSCLSKLSFCLIGFGDSAYGSNYNKASKQLDKLLRLLGALNYLEPIYLDESTDNFKQRVVDFSRILVDSLENANENKTQHEHKNGLTELNKPIINSHEDELEFDDDSSTSDNQVVDLEDLGSYIKQDSENNDSSNTNKKEMLTKLQRASLTKQGYKIIGSHSGVKICRWTKAMLRGRGGCYKHTFYGIESHRCMEMTPSLACANKCVFCWRHHTNPVGTEWKWLMDEPEFIVNEAIKNHCSMMKQMKGVPGVKPDKFVECMQVAHCALSLVGEPIMYPKINSIVQSLHSKSISTFLVTNAQFPDAIMSLIPVTQLYVSIDASNRDQLKKIDRPLFSDFWERFISSIQAISTKSLRTVFRLTLVKGYNVDEIEGYAKLIRLGNPCFIEIKGVTYCGDTSTSKNSGDSLTLNNVPWHSEVVEFCSNLVKHLDGEYEIACEHEHSCCVLIAHSMFKIDGRWHTWIDYEMFHKLFSKWQETSGLQTFEVMDYVKETPDWAIFESPAAGFDPEQIKVRTKPKAK